MATSGTISLLLTFSSVSTIAICIILKVPQIFGILRNKSIRGLSAKSVFLELYGYTTVLCYSFANGYPFSTYAEYTFLVIQDAIMIGIILHYLDQLNSSSIVLLGLFASLEVTLALQLLPNWITYLLINMCIPISASSKILQLKTILDNKDAGQVSLLTWSMAAYTCASRIFTGLYQVGDTLLLLNLSIGLLLNLAVVLATLHFNRITTLKPERKMA